MAHLKRYMMPKAWPVAVKEETFIIRPCPGPHPLKSCMPLQIIVRDLLGLAETAAETRQILNAGKVMIDKKVRKNPKFPVGLMDIIEISGTGNQYMVSVNKRGLFLDGIKAAETSQKLCMITGKKTIKAGAEQLNLHDGRNILIWKDHLKQTNKVVKHGTGKDKDHNYKVQDSVVISLPDQKIVKHYKLEKGGHAFIFSGKNVGTSGTIKEVKTRTSMTEKSTVKIKSGEREIETLKDYVFVGELKGNGKGKK